MNEKNRDGERDKSKNLLINSLRNCHDTTEHTDTFAHVILNEFFMNYLRFFSSQNEKSISLLLDSHTRSSLVLNNVFFFQRLLAFFLIWKRWKRYLCRPSANHFQFQNWKLHNHWKQKKQRHTENGIRTFMWLSLLLAFGKQTEKKNHNFRMAIRMNGLLFGFCWPFDLLCLFKVIRVRLNFVRPI